MHSRCDKYGHVLKRSLLHVSIANSLAFSIPSFDQIPAQSKYMYKIWNSRFPSNGHGWHLMPIDLMLVHSNQWHVMHLHGTMDANNIDRIMDHDCLVSSKGQCSGPNNHISRAFNSNN